ncbi:MAG TPA: hypothetical protein VFQ35_26060, partial [Polyangiaceae bacterium]|nr:hypothetical protein [Polyangiaceae bacterium]
RVAPCVTLAFTALLTHCESDTGFACGTQLRKDSTIIQTCTRNLEICVCATTSCAKPDLGLEDDSAGAAHASSKCESGYRYVEAPFADPGWAGRCVPKSHLREYPYVPNASNAGPLCPTLPYPVKGEGGTSSGGAASGGTGGMSSSGSDSGGTNASGNGAGGGSSGGVAFGGSSQTLGGSANAGESTIGGGGTGLTAGVEG